MRRTIWIAAAAASVALGLIALEKDSIAVRFGGLLWMPVRASDAWVPAPLKLALSGHPPQAEAGRIAWRTLAPGFETGELPATANGMEVERVALARIDPARFRFAVENAPKGDKDLAGWMKTGCPVLAVNGSYYTRDGLPQTPVVSGGKPLGPAQYDARQGAFVSTRAATGLRDLAHEDWRKALAGADAAMVSYPLLLAADGTSRAPPSDWLANRSFLGEDASHRIVIGTTKGAFFSLPRLAAFLKAAPLGLALALNLDGGPVACQAVSLNGFERRQCGQWEIRVENGRAKMLPTLQLLPKHMLGTPPMPMALLVYARKGC